MSWKWSQSGPPRAGPPWRTAIAICLCWLSLLAFAIARLKPADGWVVALLAIVPAAATCALCLRHRADRAPRLVRSREVEDPSSGDGRQHPSHASSPRIPEAVEEDSMTRSGYFAAPSQPDSLHRDVRHTGDFLIIDMVNRLEPRQFRWLESSLAEQQFLGWSLSELQGKSFFEIVHADDRGRAEEGLNQALAKGELLGLVVRIKTAQGRSRAVEINAGARFTSDGHVSYVRCHLTDVTIKVRAERELRLRARELMQLNEQLRQINRELEELKDRYGDLYQNAPAMYFSLDPSGRLVECNQTFLSTLQRGREELVGQGFDRFLAGDELVRCQALYARLLETGSLETESRWVSSRGATLPVWISGKVIRGPKGNVEQTRCIAQDLTAMHRLEAQLQESNRSLARANTELSRKNRELDEFVYVISHDLQEPLRTLTALADYLLQDHSGGLDSAGQEYTRRLASAARRMRTMIHALLNLSRAGKVTGESVPVPLGPLVDDVRADLSELIRSRHAEVRVASPDAVLQGDRRRLHQLLTNLVTNAIKYNQSPVPSVEVGTLGLADGNPRGAEGTGPSQTLYVRDNGIGIDPRHHDRVFQVFRRLHAQEDYEGSGVGLAICTKIAQAHGGRIWVESEPEKGATFFVAWPGPADEAAATYSPSGKRDVTTA